MNGARRDFHHQREGRKSVRTRRDEWHQRNRPWKSAEQSSHELSETGATRTGLTWACTRSSLYVLQLPVRCFYIRLLSVEMSGPLTLVPPLGSFPSTGLLSPTSTLTVVVLSYILLRHAWLWSLRSPFFSYERREGSGSRGEGRWGWGLGAVEGGETEIWI